MEPERRKQIVLGALALVLGVVVFRAWSSSSLPPITQAGRARRAEAEAGRRAAQTPPIQAPDVRLRALDEERPKPDDRNRNLFRFETRSVAPPVARGSAPADPAPPPFVVPSGPPPPPPLPPIPLKFIGIVEETVRSQRIAVLSDGRNTFYGLEGATIEGRYRIVRIGSESVDMAYLDGRGRQTIRLSGS